MCFTSFVHADRRSCVDFDSRWNHLHPPRLWGLQRRGLMALEKLTTVMPTALLLPGQRLSAGAPCGQPVAALAGGGPGLGSSLGWGAAGWGPQRPRSCEAGQRTGRGIWPGWRERTWSSCSPPFSVGKRKECSWWDVKSITEREGWSHCRGFVWATDKSYNFFPLLDKF